MSRPVVGGGVKKVLYALQTAQRIGLENTAKALTAHNTCKACGLGMGGQKGGMTNEAGEFPSVCNKSIQAQSTDIQSGIPLEVLTHSLADLRELDGYELEHLGRLATPIWKPKDNDRYQPISWDEALDLAAARFAAATPERSFFYSSGRSSNEAGFILQLLARAFGTNNVNNCSYYCHQATGVGLGSTIGTGTSTVELEDLDRCDFVLVIGANPSSNHPRLIHKLKAVRDRGGEVVIINPAKEAGLVRFALPKSVKSILTGGDWIASDYLQPRIGGDMAVLKGLAKAVLAAGAQDDAFISAHSNGFAIFRADIEATGWEEIETQSGLSRGEIERVAGLYCKAQSAVFAWGMGITHHLNGCDRIGFKLYLTTTLNKGHIHGCDQSEALILPVTARDEEWQPTTQESMFNFVRLSDGGITRLRTVRPESDILCDLAMRLMPESPIDFTAFKQHRTVREAIARIVPGMEDLADIDVAKREFHVRGRLLHTPQFHTIDGKASFVTRPLPKRRDGLWLTTVRSEGQFNSIIYERTDSYRGGIDRWSVMLNAEDLVEQGFKDGDIATLESDNGVMEGVTLRAFDIARGSVMAYYPEANCLTGTAVDPRSQTPSFKATAVRLISPARPAIESGRSASN